MTNWNWNNDLNVFKSNIKDISSNILSEVSQTLRGESSVDRIAMSELQNGMARNQVIAKVVSTVLGVTASFALTYFGIKWLTEAMDPTKKEKTLAQAEVSTAG